MKTTISKESTITILENGVRQQMLCNALMDTFGADCETYSLHLDKFLLAIYGIDIRDMPMEEEDLYDKAFNDVVDLKNIDSRTKATLINDRIILLLSKSKIEI